MSTLRRVEQRRGMSLVLIFAITSYCIFLKLEFFYSLSSAFWFLIVSSSYHYPSVNCRFFLKYFLPISLSLSHLAPIFYLCDHGASWHCLLDHTFYIVTRFTFTHPEHRHSLSYAKTFGSVLAEIQIQDPLYSNFKLFHCSASIQQLYILIKW